jgi:hypothetical protein
MFIRLSEVKASIVEGFTTFRQVLWLPSSERMWGLGSPNGIWMRETRHCARTGASCCQVSNEGVVRIDYTCSIHFASPPLINSIQGFHPDTQLSVVDLVDMKCSSDCGQSVRIHDSSDRLWRTRCRHLSPANSTTVIEVTVYWLSDGVVFPSRPWIFALPSRSDKLSSQHSFLCRGYWCLFPGDKAAEAWIWSFVSSCGRACGLTVTCARETVKYTVA